MKDRYHAAGSLVLIKKSADLKIKAQAAIDKFFNYCNYAVYDTADWRCDLNQSKVPDTTFQYEYPKKTQKGVGADHGEQKEVTLKREAIYQEVSTREYIRLFNAPEQAEVQARSGIPSASGAIHKFTPIHSSMEWMPGVFAIRELAQDVSVDPSDSKDDIAIPKKSTYYEVPIVRVEVLAFKAQYGERTPIWIPFSEPITISKPLPQDIISTVNDDYYKMWDEHSKEEKSNHLPAVQKFYSTYKGKLTHALNEKRAETIVTQLNKVNTLNKNPIKDIDLAIFLALHMQLLIASYTPRLFSRSFNPKGEFVQRTNFLITQLTNGQYASTDDLVLAYQKGSVQLNNQSKVFNELLTEHAIKFPPTQPPGTEYGIAPIKFQKKK